MNINMTLIAQMIAFALFVAFCAKFIWPVLINAMRERQATIAQGLENAATAASNLEQSEAQAAELKREARVEADQILAQARQQAAAMVEDAKTTAREEGERLLESARADVDQELNRARETLRAEVASIAVAGAERILRADIDRHKHSGLLEDIAAKL